MSFRFRLETGDGEPAEPPTLSSAVPNWRAGDTIPLAADKVLRVVDVRDDDADQPPVLVDEGPPLEIEALGLERHQVFVSEHEAVFVFEGKNAAAAVNALMHSPDVLKAAVRWRRILAGRPRLAEERFAWRKADEPRAPRSQALRSEHRDSSP